MSDADRVFLETMRRLAPRRFAQEDVHVALRLAQVEPGKPIADLGCGYGRHLRELLQYGHRATGIDWSALLLSEARLYAPGARIVRADLRALPLHQGSLAAAFCFYSSMFLGSDEDAALALVEAARVLRPGGTLAIADIVSGRPLKERTRRNVELWAACIAGAIPMDGYLNAMQATGLHLTGVRRNDYHFLSERAMDACSTYEVESISLVAVPPR
jgi:arsenite methyltransferase